VNQAAWVKPVVKGAEQKTIAAVSSRKKSNAPRNFIVEKNNMKRVSMST